MANDWGVGAGAEWPTPDPPGDPPYRRPRPHQARPPTSTHRMAQRPEDSLTALVASLYRDHLGVVPPEDRVMTVVKARDPAGHLIPRHDTLRGGCEGHKQTSSSFRILRRLPSVPRCDLSRFDHRAHMSPPPGHHGRLPVDFSLCKRERRDQLTNTKDFESFISTVF